MKNFQSTIKLLLENFEYSEPIAAVLQLIVDDKMNSLERDKALAVYGIRRITDMKEYTLDVFIDYANLCLADDAISEEEFRNMRLFKIFLGIAEGDFAKNHKMPQVKDVISKQIEKIYSDGQVDYEEILHMDNLQGTFGLSYGDFQKIVEELKG